MFRRVKAV